MDILKILLDNLDKATAQYYEGAVEADLEAEAKESAEEEEESNQE